MPLVDTPSKVVERLLDLYDDVKAAGRHLDNNPAAFADAKGLPRADSSPTTRSMTVNPDEPPDLTHTRIVQGSFAGKAAGRWNDLVHLAHREAFKRLATLEKVRSISRSNILHGHYRSAGFQHLKDLGISIQNVNANDAWRRALHIARKLNLPIHVEVEWKKHRGSALPDQRRTLAWRPELKTPAK
jgi:hypothetical protein